MIAYFERFALRMTLAEARSAAHQGQCDADVAWLRRQPHMARQLARISDADLNAELSAYGAWDEEERADRDANEARIVWLAACQIREEHA